MGTTSAKPVLLKQGTPLKVLETLEILVGDDREPGRYHSRIEDFINGGVVISAPVFIEGRTLLRNHCEVLVNITRDDAIYQFGSRIRQGARPGGSAILTPPKNIRRVQRRLFCRVQIMERIQYAPIQPSMDWDDYDEKLDWTESSSHDISGGGMLISLKNKIAPEQLLLVRIPFFQNHSIPGLVVAVSRRARFQNGRLLAGVEFLTVERLGKFFTRQELKRLPVEATRFDRAAQDRLVTMTFNRQIALRNKGLL